LKEDLDMGQRANSGRNASLDQKKERMAGRSNTDSPQRQAVKDNAGVGRAKGAAGGAHGRGGLANRKRTGVVGEGAGGGGASPKSDLIEAGRSTRPARKRGPAK
jgi:hypothetical protein